MASPCLGRSEVQWDLIIAPSQLLETQGEASCPPDSSHIASGPAGSTEPTPSSTILSSASLTGPIFTLKGWALSCVCLEPPRQQH